MEVLSARYLYFCLERNSFHEQFTPFAASKTTSYNKFWLSQNFDGVLIIWFDSFKANYEPTLKKQFHFIYASKSPKEDFGRVLIIALFPLGTNDEKN